MLANNKGLAKLLLITAAMVMTSNAQRFSTRQLSKVRNEPTRKILGTSVLASVSVLTNYANGTAIKSPVRPTSLLNTRQQSQHGQSGQHSASSASSARRPASSPTVVAPSEPTFEFYTFNSFGQLVKQFLTLSQIEAKVKHKDKPSKSALLADEESHDDTTTSTTTESTTTTTTMATTPSTTPTTTTTEHEPSQHFFTHNYHTHQQQPFHDPNYWVTKPYPGQKPSAYSNEEKDYHLTAQRHPSYNNNAWNSLYSARREESGGHEEEIQQLGAEKLMSDQIATASDEDENVGSQVAAPGGFTFIDDSPWRPVVAEPPAEFSEPAESLSVQQYEDQAPAQSLNQEIAEEQLKKDPMLSDEIITSYSQPVLPPQFRLPAVSNVQLTPGGMPLVQSAFNGERNAEVSSVVSNIQGLISQAAGFDVDRLSSIQHQQHSNFQYSATVEDVDPPALTVMKTSTEKTTTTTEMPKMTTPKPRTTTAKRRTTTTLPTTLPIFVEEKLPELITNENNKQAVYPERKPNLPNNPTSTSSTDVGSQYDVMPPSPAIIPRRPIPEDVVWGSGHLDQGPPLPPDLLDATTTESAKEMPKMREPAEHSEVQDKPDNNEEEKHHNDMHELEVIYTTTETAVQETEATTAAGPDERTDITVDETKSAVSVEAPAVDATTTEEPDMVTGATKWILGNDKTIIVPLPTLKQQLPTTILLKRLPSTFPMETTTETLTTADDDQLRTTVDMDMDMKTTGFILEQGKITPISIPVKETTKLHFKLARPTKPTTSTESVTESTTEMATQTPGEVDDYREPAAEPESEPQPEPSGDDSSQSNYEVSAVADLLEEPLQESPRLKSSNDAFDIQGDEDEGTSKAFQQYTEVPTNSEIEISTTSETVTDAVTASSSEIEPVTQHPHQKSTPKQQEELDRPTVTLSMTQQLEQQRGKPSIQDGTQTGLVYRPLPDLTNTQAPSYALKPAGANNNRPFIPKPIRVPGYTAVQQKIYTKPVVTLQQQKLHHHDEHDTDEYVLGVHYGPTKAQIESSQAFQVEPYMPEKRPLLHHDEAVTHGDNKGHDHVSHAQESSTQSNLSTEDHIHHHHPEEQQPNNGTGNSTQEDVHDHGHEHVHAENHEADHSHDHHHHPHEENHAHEHDHHHQEEGHTHEHNHHHGEGHGHDHHGSHRHSQTEKLLNLVPHGHLGLEKQFSTLLDDVKEFVRNYNELGLKAYRVLVKEFAEENLVTSPFGLCSILSALFLGTRGQTAEELDRLLMLDQPRSFNAHLFNRNLTSDLINDPSLNAGVIHEVFVQLSKGAPLNFYKTMLQHFYGAHVDRIPFRSATAAVKSFTEQRIRLQREQTKLRWVQKVEKKRRSHDDKELLAGKSGDTRVEQETMGESTTEDPMNENLKEKEMYEARILSPLILADLRVRPPLSVVNVNSFHGKWKWENSTRLVDEYDFIKLPSAHRRLIKVAGIEQEADLYIGYDPDLDVTLVEIPYSNTDFGLVLMLPGDPATFSRTGVRELEEKLTVDKLSSMLRRMIIRRTKVRLPMMSNKFVLHMEDVLGMLGANTMFDANLADFSGVNGLNDLHLKDIVQVNELTITHVTPENKLGTALGNSSLLKTPVTRDPKQEPSYSVKKEEPMFTVDFNRDFLYIVRHHPTGILIHLGRYVNPFT